MPSPTILSQPHAGCLLQMLIVSEMRMTHSARKKTLDFSSVFSHFVEKFNEITI